MTVAMADEWDNTPVTKAKPSSTDFMEVGSAGLHQNGGIVADDFLRQLQGKQKYANFREMADNDPVVGGYLNGIEMIVRSVDWSVKPADENDERAVAEAEFVSGCLTDMSTTWDDTLASILTFLVYGFSYHEIVYKYRKGYTNDAKTCLLYTSPSPRDGLLSRMPSSA